MLLKNRIVWQLTKHSRARFILRVGLMEDLDMVKSAQAQLIMGFFRGFDFHWRWDWNQRDAKRLITIYFDNADDCSDAFGCFDDPPSEFTFHYSQFERRFT